jgi:hypothetical protein
VSYLFSCIPFLAGIAIIVLGVTMVRKASPRAGYLFAAAGALELLAVCCIRGLNSFAAERFGPRDVYTITAVLGGIESLLAMVLIAVAFALLAKGNPGSRVS